MLGKQGKLSIVKVSLLQAVGILIYIFSISFIFLNGSEWFGPKPGLLGPILFLTLFSVSVLICGLLVGGYAVWLYLQKKDATSSIKIIGLTTMWLFLFFLLILYILILN